MRNGLRVLDTDSLWPPVLTERLNPLAECPGLGNQLVNSYGTPSSLCAWLAPLYLICKPVRKLRRIWSLHTR